MNVGELVQVKKSKCGPEWPGAEAVYTGMSGVIVRDHSPMRPACVGRVVDVMWSDGTVEDMYSDDLEVVDESR